jgi:uncharacterized protein YlxW (UPF0749 family)
VQTRVRDEQPKHKAGKRPREDPVPEESVSKRKRREELRKSLIELQSSHKQQNQATIPYAKHIEMMNKKTLTMEEMAGKLGLIGLGIGVVIGLGCGYMVFTTSNGVSNLLSPEPPKRKVRKILAEE